LGFRVDLDLVVVVEREHPGSAGNRTSVVHSVISNFSYRDIPGHDDDKCKYNNNNNNSKGKGKAILVTDRRDP
jgi:hypothetical protein